MVFTKAVKLGVASAALAASCSLSVGAQLLPFQDFETGTPLPAGWTSIDVNGTAQWQNAAPNVGIPGGSQSASLTVTGAATENLRSPDFTHVVGEFYEVTFFIQADQAAGITRQITLTVANANVISANLGTISNIGTTGRVGISGVGATATQVTLVYQAINAATTRLTFTGSLNNLGNPSGTNTLRIDNVSVRLRVPELDGRAAALPIAFALGCLLTYGDRRRRVPAMASV